MSKPKPIENIHWLSDDDYKKASFQLRSGIDDILGKTYSMYGMDAYHLGARNAIMKLAEDFALRCRGVDKPISINYESPQ